MLYVFCQVKYIVNLLFMSSAILALRKELKLEHQRVYQNPTFYVRCCQGFTIPHYSPYYKRIKMKAKEQRVPETPLMVNFKQQESHCPLKILRLLFSTNLGNL